MRQRLSAIILIVALLPMLAATMLHTHHHKNEEGTRCEQCVRHIPHATHFDEKSTTIDHCLICQLITTPYDHAENGEYMFGSHYCVSLVMPRLDAVATSPIEAIALRGPPAVFV